MIRRHWLILPFAYTVVTRLRSVGGVLDHLTRDVAIPLIPAVALFGQNGSLAVVLWLGFASLYEVGYLLNDEPPSAVGEDGRDRLDGEAVPWGLAVGLRLVVWASAVWWAISASGWWVGMTYVVVSALVVGTLLVHAFLASHTPTVRFFSFALLSLFKYAPFLVPLIGWEHAMPYLGSIFLMYGFPRSVHYVMRKMLPSERSAEVDRFELLSHGLGLFPASVIVAPDLLAWPDQGWTAPALLWALYLSAWVAALVSRRDRSAVVLEL
jgi:hypothetical protein